MAVHPSGQRRLVIVLASATLVASLLVAVEPAKPEHIPGATYNGTLPSNGTISFGVSADGSQVQSLQVSNLPCDAHPGTANASVPNIPISSGSSPHSFTHNAAGVFVTGRFGLGVAEGQLAIIGCNNAPVPWRARAPCRCDSVTTFSRHQRQFFSIDDRQQFDRQRRGVVANFFKTTKRIRCKGVSPPNCRAKLEIQIAQGDQDIAQVPKSEREVKCKARDCPKRFRRSFEWRLRVWTGALKKKGVRKIHGRFKITCDGKTIFVPWVIGLKPGGRVSKDDTDLGNPA